MTTRHPSDADEGTLAPPRPVDAPPLPPSDAELGPSPVFDAPAVSPPQLAPDLATPQFSQEMIERVSPAQPGWTTENFTALEFSMLHAFPDISKDLLDDTMQMVMNNGDPTTVLEGTQQKFQRQVGLSTQEMFEERTLMGLLGVTPDDEAFSQAAIDTFLETGGAARTAATVFAQAEDNNQWFTAAFLEQKNVRDEAIKRVAKEASDEGLGVNPDFIRYGDIVSGLLGKELEWNREGDELALRWHDAEGGGAPVDVLIHLEPGTTTDTATDVLIEYLLADDGLRHVVAPSSGEVTGRQTWIGALIEGTDNIVQGIERRGTGFVTEISKQVSSEMHNMGLPDPNPSPTQQATDDERAREMETRNAVSRRMESDAIVAIMQREQAENPEMSMSSLVAAGIAGLAEIPDEVKETAVTESIADLEAAATQKRNEQSRLGRFIEEDVAPPVLDVLSAWDSAIHFMGIVASDLTNVDGVNQLVRAVADEGIGALDAQSIGSAAIGAIAPGTPDLESLKREMANVSEEGLPLAMGSYLESVKEIGTMAEYYGIDEDSGFATWVNTYSSIAWDPITYATLGGNASWNALRRGVTTTAGAERLLQSRPVMSMARNIVKNDRVAIIPLLAADNMSSTGIVRLAKISKTRYVTKEAVTEAMGEVIDILRYELPGNGGFWIPSGPARVLRRKTTAGISNLARITPKDPKARSFLRDVLVRSSRRRFASINERSFLNDFFQWTEVRRADDAVGFADDIAAAVERYEAYRAGDSAVGLLEGRIQVLRQEIADLTMLPPEVSQTPKLRKMVSEWNDSVKELDSRIARETDDATREAFESSRASAIRSRDEAQALVDEVGDTFDKRTREVARKRTELKQSQAQIEEMGTAGRDRSMLEQFMHEYIDDWAEELGIPVKELPDGSASRHKLFPHLPERDWSSVLGSSNVTKIDETVSPLMPFGDDASDLAALGMRSQAGVTPMPISAHEMLAYATMQESRTGRKAWEFFKEHPGFKNTMDNLQGMWAIQVLGNIRTIMRSHLDEVIRFYEDAGMNANTLKTTSPVGQVGPEARMFARDQMDSFLAPSQMGWKPVSPAERGMWVHAERWINGTMMQDPIFKAYARAVTNATDEIVTGTRFVPKETLRKLQFDSRAGRASGTKVDDIGRRLTEGGARDADFAIVVELDKYGNARLKDGNHRMTALMENPDIDGLNVRIVRSDTADFRGISHTADFEAVTQGFAQHLVGADNSRALWEQWWNETGVKLAKRTTLNGTEITAGNSFDIIKNSFDRWLSGVTPSTSKGVTLSQVQDDMLRAAAAGDQVAWKPAVYRQLPPVPAQLSTDVGAGKGFRHAMDRVFQVGYGNPQQRRGSVFYDHYYGWAKSVYDDAFSGKVLDEEWLLNNGHATSQLHAQELLNQGRRSQTVRNLIEESGMRLDTDIQNAAMNWGAASADDMMYTFGAASMFGRKLARVYPFGRAQTDYLQWWWGKLTQPTQLVTGHQIPGVNIRLADRMAHLTNLGSPDGERPGALTPAGVVNNFTFLPTSLDEQIVLDTVPSLGPMAGWMVNLPGVPDEARNFIQEIHPSHRIFSEPFDGPADALKGAFDALFPKGGLSVRNQASAAWRLGMYAVAAISVGYDPSLPVDADGQRTINKAFNGFVTEAAGGPWRNDYVKLDAAQWLEDNAFDAIPTLDPSSDVIKDWNLRNDKASRESLLESTTDFFGKIAGVASYGGSDFSYVESLMAVDKSVDKWFDSGSISDAKRDAIMIGWNLINSGEATAKDRLTFADEVLDSVFSLLTDDERTEFFALNPGVSANMVSFMEVVPELVPEDAADAIVNGRIKTADITRARDLRSQGRDEGWLVARDANEVRYDMLVSAHRSFREYLDVIYERGAGVAIGARSVEIGDKKVSIDKVNVTLTPEWWDEHKEWLGQAGSFELPGTIQADLENGDPAKINIGELHAAILTAKKAFSYEFTISAETETKLNRIGLDEAAITTHGLRVKNEFVPPEFTTVSTAYYGQQLMDDFNDALKAGQDYAGWSDMTEWENDFIIVPGEDDEGNAIKITHSLDDLRSRFRVAVALSASAAKPDENNFDQYTEKDYANSTHGYNLGELNWETPQPPPLTEVAAYHEVSDKGLMQVVDGDTIEIMSDDGPMFVRLIGINAPEQGKRGYEAAWRELSDIIANAESVQFAVWEPDRYGLKTSTFAKEDNAIVHRDRLLVWLYIDGVPLFDPDEFSQTNIRGVRTGGTVQNLQRLLSMQKGGG